MSYRFQLSVIYSKLIQTIFRPSFLTDPCEYENIAHSNLAVVRNLIIRLLDYQKKALPPWYPRRDSLANPALLGGSWGPWKASDSYMSQTKGENRTASYTANEIKPNDNSKHLNGFRTLHNITKLLKRENKLRHNKTVERKYPNKKF